MADDADELASDLQEERSMTVRYRREADRVVNQLVADVAVLKDQMIQNTEVTKEVRDILGSFKLMAKLSKWGTAIGASLAGVYFSWKGLGK